MTFAKKAQTGGYFYKDSLRVDAPYRIYNTWLGDPIRILYLEAIIETMRKDNLIELNRSVGKLYKPCPFFLIFELKNNDIHYFKVSIC